MFFRLRWMFIHFFLLLIIHIGPPALMHRLEVVLVSYHEQGSNHAKTFIMLKYKVNLHDWTEHHADISYLLFPTCLTCLLLTSHYSEDRVDIWNALEPIKTV